MFEAEILTLAQSVLDACRARNWRLATAESRTGGLLAGALTAIAGSSDVVERGFVIYSNEAKSELLGVPPEAIAAHGAVSAETAAAMAQGALARAPVDVAVSVTGIVAGGANVVCFTTGRGSAFGCTPVPSIKVATNSALLEHMNDDMDINAGVILDGTPVEAVGKQIFEEILAVDGGKKTKSEINGVGEEEFAPWSIGPTL